MSRRDTVRSEAKYQPGAAATVFSKVLSALVFCSFSLVAQPLEWRNIGNTLIDEALASPASGPIERVWYSTDGSRLYVLTAKGRIFETNDFETWQVSSAKVPPVATERRRRVADPSSPVVYSLDRVVFRSSDEGRNWRNVSESKGQSVVGDGLSDLAVSPRDGDEIAVASRNGVWRSLDGGLTWAGVNEGLPNLPVRKLLRVPSAAAPARILLDREEAVWRAGQKIAWTATTPDVSVAEIALREGLSAALGETVSVVAASGDMVYAGTRAGRLWSSADRGKTWQAFNIAEAGAVESITLVAADPRLALAATGNKLVRTINGGLFWDDLGVNRAVHASAVDLATGAVYAATSDGLFQAYTDLRSLGPVPQWQPVPGRLPAAPVIDVQLDEAGNQLYAVLEGYGVYATLAPHRLREPRIVNAADGSTRAAAPGTLLSVIGSQVSSAKAGELNVPILAASAGESQIQVPFEVSGDNLSLALKSQTVIREYALPLQAVSPAIFVDRDGAPMLLDADRGLLLEASSPARAGSRIQILATGLGKVTPDWPTGLPAPADNTPRVVAPVKVFLDRSPVEVTRAVLAPGYVGFYLVEVQLPDVVNNGPAELYIEAAGQPSARVSVFLVQ